MDKRKLQCRENMPETNTNTQLNDKNQKLLESSTPPPITLLRFRRPLIILAHIFAFAASLMLSFLLVHLSLIHI